MLEATSVLEGPARPHDASYENGVGRLVTARRRQVPLADSYRTLTSAEILRDHYAAELPPGYDLILEFTSERVCLTAKGPSLRER